MQLAGTTFRTWAQANVPAGAYQGTDPIGAMVDAFCDPAADESKSYFFGGGHGAGTCNAVVEFDRNTLTYRLAGQPTPPATYPPNQAYPSGINNKGFYLPLSMLPNPVDHPYAAPQLAWAARHMYGAAIKRGNVLYYFYAGYAEFNVVNGEWGGFDIDIGAQVNAINPAYTANVLQQGTMAIYDDVTDRVYITFTSGDLGLNARGGLIQFNPETRTVEVIHGGGIPGVASMNLVRVDRKIYVFNKEYPGGYPQAQMNNGWIFDMDTKTTQRFTISGTATDTQFNTEGGGCETVPSCYDGAGKIYRWNFYGATAKAKLLTVNLTPTSGSGTNGDPFVLQQTSRAIAGTPPANPWYVYTRLYFNRAAGCLMVLPKNDETWFALKPA
jgi:hypothetical protein